MKKGNLFNYSKLSKYIKLAIILLIDAIPVYFTIRVTAADGVDSDFLGLGLMVMFFFFVIFNLWAFFIFFITMLIRKIWLRDILFYLLLFLYLFSPLLIPGLFIGAEYYPY